MLQLNRLSIACTTQAKSLWVERISIAGTPIGQRVPSGRALISIGKYMGDRDHATVIHGAEKIEKEITTNENTRNVIDVLIKKINPN